MLVLTRKESESVLLGDEVTLTVEEIIGQDGQRIAGAKVRLGLQLPHYVSVARNERRVEHSAVANRARPRQPARRRIGQLVEIPDAVVRLRIQVPSRVPVHCNGMSATHPDSEQKHNGDAPMSETEYHVTCRTDDRITICNNMTIATLKFHRYVSQGPPREWAIDRSYQTGVG